MSLEGQPGRLDRILWCPDPVTSYQPQSIALFGRKPFVSDNIQLYPSDHFGVCGVFKISSATAAPSSIARVDLTAIAPVYESILAIIPPEDLFPPIQAIRQQYDAGFVRIVPHITLLYGFLPDRYFEEVVDLIAPILAKIEPFTVTLADFEVFTHHKSSDGLFTSGGAAGRGITRAAKYFGSVIPPMLRTKHQNDRWIQSPFECRTICQS